jgi:hypothetical protein
MDNIKDIETCLHQFIALEKLVGKLENEGNYIMLTGFITLNSKILQKHCPVVLELVDDKFKA